MKWFWSGRPLASASEVSSGSTVTSNVILTGLKRSDDGILLTCEAQNNNISTPVKHSVVVTMNCKFNLKSVFDLANVTAALVRQLLVLMSTNFHTLLNFLQFRNARSIRLESTQIDSERPKLTFLRGHSLKRIFRLV